MQTSDRRIWKYEVAFDRDVTECRVPAGSKALHAGMQGDKLCVWVAVDVAPGRELETKGFSVVPTGATIPEHISLDGLVATVLDGGFVWHVFEVQP